MENDIDKKNKLYTIPNRASNPTFYFILNVSNKNNTKSAAQQFLNNRLYPITTKAVFSDEPKD